MSYLINALAVFRLTWFLMYDDAPGEIMAKIRDAVGVKQNMKGGNYATNELSKVFLCEWCMSLWIGLLFARGNVKEALAYSGVTGLLFKVLK